jgi:hypothetical protein
MAYAYPKFEEKEVTRTVTEKKTVPVPITGE